MLLPPRCAGCGAITRTAHGLCASCWHKITFIGKPYCHKCGHPFPYAEMAESLCAVCPVRQMPLAYGRSALRYNDGSKSLLLGFKHRDRTEAARLLAGLLYRAAGDILPGTDALVPVPLHWQRLLKRRYNQSALIAGDLSRRTGLPVWTHVLRRTRATPAQQGKNRAERRENIAGAFTVPETARDLIHRRHVVLVDDVWTTGATLAEAAKTLKAAGAKDVSAVTVARVFQENP